MADLVPSILLDQDGANWAAENHQPDVLGWMADLDPPKAPLVEARGKKREESGVLSHKKFKVLL